MTEPDWDRYPNFARAEMVCSCGCDRAEMHPAFMDRLQSLRTQYNKPMVVTSGYRCPDYNARISSTGRDGPHTHGRAVDIAVSGNQARNLLGMAISRGFTGLGVKQHGDGRFIHMDDLMDGFAGPRPWLWSYR